MLIQHFPAAYCLFLTLLLVSQPPLAAPLDSEAVGEFVEHMAAEHQFDREALERLFAGVSRSDRIIELMSRPAEKTKPWWQYRGLFITEQRISRGVTFWRENTTTLDKAEGQFGIPPEVIVAILGVETSYGRIQGSFPVVEALGTLAFHYPGGSAKRMEFFRSELQQFLIFAREDTLDPSSVTGSYAGALGMPQFMPSNFRRLALDFDNDGKRDIWNSPADAIGSIGNYLAHHGWQRGMQIASPASGSPDVLLSLAQDSLKPERDLSEYGKLSVRPQNAPFEPGWRAALYELEGETAPEFWFGYWNFYVISRYNPRVKYAMAVAQLAFELRQRMDQQSR